MYTIKKNNITLIRGDTMIANVKLIKDGEQYIPQEGDVIRFAVKHQTLNAAQTEYTDVEPLIIKNIPTNTLVLELEPQDTKSLGFDTYDYDVEITYADGKVDTFISGKLILDKEVH